MFYFVIFITIALAVNLVAYVRIARQGALSADLIQATFPLAILLFLAMPLLPQPVLKLPDLWQTLMTVISLLLLAIGLLIGIMGFYQLKKNKTQVMPKDWIPEKIVSEGIYQKVRHPLYLSAAMLSTGYYLAMGSIYALVFILPMVYLITYVRAYVEEKYILKKNFPKQYKRYQRETGMFFPRLG